MLIREVESAPLLTARVAPAIVRSDGSPHKSATETSGNPVVECAAAPMAGLHHSPSPEVRRVWRSRISVDSERMSVIDFTGSEARRRYCERPAFARRDDG